MEQIILCFKGGAQKEKSRLRSCKKRIPSILFTEGEKSIYNEKRILKWQKGTRYD